MISSRFLSAVVAPLFVAASSLAARHPVDMPLPMVGTGGHGHAFPGAAVPFGMVQLSPDTPLEGWDGSSGYHYSDNAIRGFSHTHLSGTGVGCLGDILLTPTVGEVRLEAGTPGNGYVSRFSHTNEIATPGYYRVFLDDPKVTAELTATERCGFHRYTFPAAQDAHFILDLVHGVGNSPVEATLNIESDRRISGSRISNGWGGRRAAYFVMEFSKPFSGFGIEKDKERLAEGTKAATGRRIKAFFNYATRADEQVLVRVGISGTSVEGARKNLEAELAGVAFDKVRKNTVSKWRGLLDTVKFESFDERIRSTFYANLYLSSQAPILFNDVDGTYRGMDRKNHSTPGFQNYTIFSLWDTYRAEHPLLALLQPGRINDMVNSMIAEYEESGLHTTPIWPLWGNETWCMIGYHSIPVIVDAYFKGFRGYDVEKAYRAMRDTAMQDRNGLDTYKKLGYVASQKGAQATSKTIEYAFDDWCLAKMAEDLGHKEDAELFYKRCSNYRNHFDRTVGFFRGRKADGSWRVPFVENAHVGDEYTEADPWQYALAVQHDVPGMIDLYGGEEGFLKKLDGLFSADSTIQSDIPDITGLIGQYSHGNEPCHHVIYLYNYAGAPYKAQQRLREVMSTLYDDTPTGQCGNVDCGQMSAWYLFSALGFYPVNPNSGIYAIGSPLATKAEIKLDKKHYGGRTFKVIAENNSKENIYIQSASLNGKALSRPWIKHEEILNGGTLRFVMGSKPNMEWGRGAETRPPATMPATFKYAPLPEPSSDKPIVLTVPIRVICGSDEPAGNFVPDYNMLHGGMNGANHRIDTSVPNAAPEAVYQNERYGRDFTYGFSVPAGKYLVRLHFAEIFDNAAGMRIENIHINGKQVLENLDIWAAAGGLNKALVKEFTGIAPDANGKISIRTSAARQSPDQNAKICGIEILPE